MTNKFSLKSDSIGATASALCLAHCIATPIIFVIQPLAISEEAAPIWWKSLDYLFLLVSFFAVYWSAKNTSRNWVRYAFWVSFVALSFAIINEKLELFHLGELTVYIPATCLIGLHFYNRKYCRCEDETCCATDQS